MNETLVVGTVITVAGLAGYALGTVASYPGRALSLSALMIGITLVLVGRSDGVNPS